ncbi:hypothetical protein R1flu_001092 [Riccia fluitans]|uniref:Uncharacterized protein n=1 Tax=Riccia fluitans TaxID=41844 RepID=A0ABD1Y584_9MARC
MEFANPPTPPVAKELEVQGGRHCLPGLQVGTTAKGDAITRKQDYKGTILPNGADNQRGKYRNTTSSNVLRMLPQGGELSEREAPRGGVVDATSSADLHCFGSTTWEFTMEPRRMSSAMGRTAPSLIDRGGGGILSGTQCGNANMRGQPSAPMSCRMEQEGDRYTLHSRISRRGKCGADPIRVHSDELWEGGPGRRTGESDDKLMARGNAGSEFVWDSIIYSKIGPGFILPNLSEHSARAWLVACSLR